ncbi:MAG: hypothetical protein WBQ06_16910 [Acidobacteriaceae bacterium]
MATNRGVVYLGPGKVEVKSIDYPKMQNPAGKEITHGVILKIVSTNHLRVRSAHGAGPHDRTERPGAGT